MALNMRQEVEARIKAACRIADVQAERGQLDPGGYLAFTAAFLKARGLELSSADPALLEEALQRLVSLCESAVFRGEEAARLVQRLYAEAAASAGAPPARSAPLNTPSELGGAGTIHDGYLICLEDGKKVKLLKRHLRTHFGMTPEEYRRKWGLPDDYPMLPPGVRAATNKRRDQTSSDRDPEEPPTA